MRRLETLARFVWDFVVGDDWRMAVGVVVAIALTALLSAWWFLPVAVALLLGVSLWRAAAPR